MRALADVVVERGVSGFSVQEVADRAGVAHRTVYRHYPSREALLDGYARWLDEQRPHGVDPGEVGDADSLARAAEAAYRRFDDLGHRIDALVVASIGTRSRIQRRDERTEEFRAYLARAGALSHLSDEEAESVVALIRTLASSTSWYQLRHQHDVDGRRAGPVVAWAIATLLKALAAGDRPVAEKGEQP